MKTYRGITGSGDWIFGAGRASYFRDSAAIAADIRTSLLFFLNDCFFAMNVGVDWWNLLASKGSPAREAILVQTRAAISSREGVVRINYVDAEVDARTRAVTLRYNIDTSFSRNVTGTITAPSHA